MTSVSPASDLRSSENISATPADIMLQHTPGSSAWIATCTSISERPGLNSDSLCQAGLGSCSGMSINSEMVVKSTLEWGDVSTTRESDSRKIYPAYESD